MSNNLKDAPHYTEVKGYPTAHNECEDPSLIAKTVLMPGDPLRAKHIAELYLTDVVCFNNVRGMLGFTGKYKGKKISIMGSGMGMASIGIYSYELYKFYGVENIIRIGSAGGYTEDLNVYDTLLVTDAYSDSSFAKVGFGMRSKYMKSTASLNNKLRKAAVKLGVNMKEGRIYSSDVFYGDGNTSWKDMVALRGVKAVEMESFALFTNAKALGKKAACLLTISNSFVTNEETTAQERQTAFHDMIKIALELASNK